MQNEEIETESDFYGFEAASYSGMEIKTLRNFDKFTRILVAVKGDDPTFVPSVLTDTLRVILCFRAKTSTLAKEIGNGRRRIQKHVFGYTRHHIAHFSEPSKTFYAALYQ